MTTIQLTLSKEDKEALELAVRFAYTHPDDLVALMQHILEQCDLKEQTT